ncbi:hypothetical protein ONQ97_25515, partial [Salmonella enterica subsp. enterica serovar Virginia]|nr:hypothetical protein [Salmonella enterica subsp. enterica serovar Virginia]
EQNAGNSLVQDINSALANKPPASDAEIQLIRSRLVLGKTVDDHSKVIMDIPCIGTELRNFRRNITIMFNYSRKSVGQSCGKHIQD